LLSSSSSSSSQAIDLRFPHLHPTALSFSVGTEAACASQDCDMIWGRAGGRLGVVFSGGLSSWSALICLLLARCKLVSHQVVSVSVTPQIGQ